MAEEFESATDRSRAEQLSARSLARAHSSVGARRRAPRVAMLAASFAISALAAVGFVADSAVPGEFLYPVDRAFEAVGLYGDGAEERLEEVIVLADRGDAGRAVAAAAEALEAINRTHRSLPPTPSTTAPAPATTDTVAEAVEVAPASPSTTVGAAPPVQPTEDPVQALKLAAEYLLRAVRNPDDGAELEEAASGLALAAASVDAASSVPASATSTEEETTATTVEDSSSTSTSEGTESDTTTTTVADGSDTTTTTSAGRGGGNGSTTTTTTLPSIILPPAP